MSLMKFFEILGLILSVAISSVRAQDSVAALNEEWQILGMITGYHSFFDETRHWEIRVLEADGSATVARNPIDLFLIVTNNSSGSDLQEHVWRLPHGIEKLQKVSPIHSGLKISAMRVGGIDEKTQKAKLVPMIITARYEVNNGALSNQVVVGLTRGEH
jgi:hypothetical protein